MHIKPQAFPYILLQKSATYKAEYILSYFIDTDLLFFVLHFVCVMQKTPCV